MIVSTQSCLQRQQQPAVNDDPATREGLYPIPCRKRLPITHQGLTVWPVRMWVTTEIRFYICWFQVKEPSPALFSTKKWKYCLQCYGRLVYTLYWPECLWKELIAYKALPAPPRCCSVQWSSNFMLRTTPQHEITGPNKQHPHSWLFLELHHQQEYSTKLKPWPSAAPLDPLPLLTYPLSCTDN